MVQHFTSSLELLRCMTFHVKHNWYKYLFGLFLGPVTLVRDDVFRGCFNQDLVPEDATCLDGREYFDLSGSLPPGIQILDVDGTVCFCRSDLCNDQLLPKEPQGKTFLLGGVAVAPCQVTKLQLSQPTAATMLCLDTHYNTKTKLTFLF